MCTTCSTTKKIKTVEQKFNEINSLYNLNYTLRWNNKKRAIGQCYYTEHRIEMSKFFLTLSTEELIDTLLHEFAHALDARQRGTTDHSKYWKAWCLKIGAKPNRLKRIPKDQQPKGLYSIDCKDCGSIGYANRSRKKKYYCGHCYKRGIKNILELNKTR